MATGWAILGTGVVATKFALGLSQGGGKVVAVGTRDIARGQALLNSLPSALRAPGARALSVVDAVADPGVQAVYVATPASLHESHALLALDAGRAVLIEKPFAQDAASASRIADAARTAGVFCMEALWTRFMPMTQWLRTTAAAGTLGEIRAFQAEFMGSDIPDLGQPLFDPAMGGGALLHRGIYPISLALALLGPVTDLIATGRIGLTGVEEDVSIILTHRSGAISTLRASLRAGGTNGLMLSGTDASLRIDGPVFRPFRARLIRHGQRNGGSGGGQAVVGRLARWREGSTGQALNRIISAGPIAAMLERGIVRRPYNGNGYGHEAAEVALALQTGQTESLLMPLDDSIEVLRLIDCARAIIWEKEHVA